MMEFDRKWKDDEVIGKIYKIIKKNHKVAEHTKKVLMDNADIKDFCEEARHFIILGESKPLHIHYDVASWYQDGAALIKIESIGVYDDFLEYEVARLKGIHSTKNSDGGNLN